MATRAKPSIGAAHRPVRDVVCDQVRRRIIDGRHPSAARLVEKVMEAAEPAVADGLGGLPPDGVVEHFLTASAVTFLVEG
jgi:hypothetical protein